MANVTVYVDPGVSGGLGNGSSWANAYASLRTAVLAYAGPDLNGDDYIWLCRTVDGTKDTGHGALFETLNNFGSLTIRGADQSGNAGPLTQSALDSSRYTMLYDDSNEGIDARQPVTIEWIQFEASTAVATREAVEFNPGSGGSVMHGCVLVRSATTNTGSTSIFNIALSNGCLVYNNFFYDNVVGLIFLVNVSEDCEFYNNTLLNPKGRDSIAWLGTSYRGKIKNNICQDPDNTSWFDYDIDIFDAVTASNISEDASSPDIAFRNITLTFENKVGKDFRLASEDTAAIDAGEDLSAIFTDDFFGNTRSGWSIGAHEFGAGASAGPAARIISKAYIHGRLTGFIV